MKRFWILILASFVLLTPTGCARFPRRQLEDIESNLESRPDSALTALDAMSRRKLYTPALRAHHALLFSMALDKNYIDIADDSIARVAVDWYRFHKPLNHRMLCSIVVLFLSLSACRDGNWRYPLSQEDALEMTRHLWEEYDLVLVSKDIVPGGTTMEENFKTSVVCESDSWVIVADTKYYMFAIGEAKWLYIIVNKNTGKIANSSGQCNTVTV